MIEIIDCGFNEFFKRSKDKKIYCFGAGKQFEKFVKNFSQLNICGVIDSDTNKHNTIIEVADKQIKILPLTSFIKEYEQDHVVVITTLLFKDIINILDSYEELTGLECYIYIFLNCFTESDVTVIKYSPEKLIPKKIHYCWFGSKTLPKEFERNIDSWKRMCPDYDIIRWDESNIDVAMNLYMKQAYERKAWAFVSDVARIKAIFDEGGIYLDTDVQVIKNLDPLLGWDFFCGYQDHQQVAFGLGYGAVRHHAITKKLLDLYDQLSYVDSNGMINNLPCPYYQTRILHECGFQLNGKFEEKDGVAIFPKEFFSPFNDCKGLGRITENTYSIHWFSASWKEEYYKKKKENLEKDIQEIYKHIEFQNKSKKKYFDLTLENFDKFKKRKIIIYGAGAYGTLLFSYLKINGLQNNVVCFAVSKKQGNPEYIFDKPVVPFEKLRTDDDKPVMIVAVNKNYIDEISEKLMGEYDFFWFSPDTADEVKKEIFRIYQEVPIQKNKVFFYCYGGMGYRCNCKYIAKKLWEGNYPVEMVWALSGREDKQGIPDHIKTVIIGSTEYYKELYTSLIVIENDGKAPFVYKRQGQFCINTWHGYGPFKKVGGALPENDRKLIEEYYSYYDLFLTASSFYTQIYRDSFCYHGTILECGAPRNDVFFTDNQIKERIYQLYNIPSEKGILLLAPTFRYDKSAAFEKYNMDICQVLHALEKRFQKEYVLMYRFHHQLYESEKRINYFTDGIDVTLYPDIQELLVAADIVITDYSSLMWDFSLQRRPVFLYQKDLNEYDQHRGFYAPISQWPYPQAHTQEELLNRIEEFDEESYIQRLNSFLTKYGSCDDGHGAERVANLIMDKIQ